ncbi:hypothetical protein D0862_12072 [Hortaea werneckii]|uniref:Protein kinase domain-containing protein n=1 Tax=Hortaea werneckii TaxID=91943 RepID=A0A3M7F0F5_HORWE|nr:hypothetical protein D0862_12072 [Hortaea werneckii]
MECIDEESLSSYNPINYCSIEPGSILDESYTAMVKLGYGRTSTTWLCKDGKSTYKVLKVGAADATHREKKTFERIRLAAAQSDHAGSICVRQPERIFEFHLRGQAYNCFVFEPLGPNLLEFTNQPSNRPFGSQRVRLVATYLLHAIDFLHTSGVAHTGKPALQRMFFASD